MRNRIMKVTIEEINENGIKFTMADLAKRLAVSKSTLYAHFVSKEKLIGSIVDAILADIRQQDEKILNNETLNYSEKLQALLANEPTLYGPISNRFIFDLKRYLPEEWKKNEEHREYKWQIIELLLKQGIAAGYFRPIDLDVAKVIFLATVNELFNSNFLMQNNLTIIDAIGKMADILYYGMAGPGQHSNN